MALRALGQARNPDELASWTYLQQDICANELQEGHNQVVVPARYFGGSNGDANIRPESEFVTSPDGSIRVEINSVLVSDFCDRHSNGQYIALVQSKAFKRELAQAGVKPVGLAVSEPLTR